MSIKVSIVIPTYNRADVLKKTIESILDQTFSDWECLIIDDGSKDNTEEVVNGYAKIDNRISYYHNKRNKGAQGARNTGLYLAKGNWVFFFDSDNIMHQNCLSTLMSSVKDDIDVVSCFSEIIDINNGPTGRFLNSVNTGFIHDKLFLGGCYVDFNQAIIRKEKLLLINGLDENCPSMQEWDTHIRLSRYARYLTVTDTLVDYFIGGKDAISSDLRREVVGRLYIFQKHRKEWYAHYPGCLKYVTEIRTFIHKNSSLKFRLWSSCKLFAVAPKVYVKMQLLSIYQFLYSHFRINL